MAYCQAEQLALDSSGDVAPPPGSILSVEYNQNVESKTKNVESKIAFNFKKSVILSLDSSHLV